MIPSLTKISRSSPPMQWYVSGFAASFHSAESFRSVSQSRSCTRPGEQPPAHFETSSYGTCRQLSPLSGAQFCPIRHPPTPSKSTQRIGRQSAWLTHLRRLMLHSPIVQLSWAQSESCWQVQNPVGSPSATLHCPTQKPT